jgi:hypothetical protein
MKTMKIALAAAAALAAAPLAAQNDIETVCETEVPAVFSDRCAAVAQAVDAAQPQLGMLMAGGNPILGTASTGGVRLGVIPRVSFSARVNVVAARLPDIRELQDDENATTEQFSVPAPAVGANLSVGLTQGFNLAPMLGGFGAIDLLGSVSVLPLSLVDGFGGNAFSWGAGARVGLLRESFVTPGLSASVMYRSLGEVSFGEVCTGTETPSVLAPADPDRSLCTGGGDFGEISFGLSNISGRAALSKRLLGLGLTGGIGYDRFETDADFGFGTPEVADAREIFRFRDVAVDNDRFSMFADASFTLLVASLVAEVGWMEGAIPITGFSDASDFDPRQGTWFGSLGAKISL